ncbi:hypothetical protein CGRA01v4_03776 [Colletotrichum graminicola]|nr:hypothetical protein CGRA01v4_03776 [Colletotrichum graminicola]
MSQQASERHLHCRWTWVRSHLFGKRQRYRYGLMGYQRLG